MCTRASQSGVSLAEYVVSLGVAALVLLVILAFSIFARNSFASTANLVDLDEAGRLALDTMSREIRQADKVANLTPKLGRITFLSGNTSFSYVYSSSTRTLSRVSGTEQKVLLRDCDYVRYDMFQRNATNGTYDYYATANTNTCKVVQLTWLCTRSFLGRNQVVSHQSARVVMRNQK